MLQLLIAMRWRAVPILLVAGLTFAGSWYVMDQMWNALARAIVFVPARECNR